MDIGLVLISAIITIYCFYSFIKSKLDIYLIFGTLSWYCIFHHGSLSLYQFLREPLKLVVDFITIFFKLRIFIPLFRPYLKKVIQDYKEYRGYNS